MFKLDPVSLKNLEGVHPHLVRVVHRAAELSPIPFRVTEGLRTLARQKQLKRQGMSKTLNSRHLTGHAVDIVPMVDVTGDGKVTGEDMWHHAQLVKLAPYIKQAFAEYGVPYEWGGDWRNAWDKPHWQLPWKSYPAQATTGDLKVAMAEPAMESPAVRPMTANVIGSSGAAAGAVGLISQTVSDLQTADSYFSAGSVFGFVIGGLVLAGAAIALYSQWDAAGRPLPWKRKA